MPELEIQFPAGTFPDAQSKAAFMDAVAAIVAVQMSGANYTHQHFDLGPGDVEIELREYEPENVRHLATPFRVKVLGYDYPERLMFLPIWINFIGRDMAILIRDTLGTGFEDLKRKLVSITFLSYGEGHWVSF